MDGRVSDERAARRQGRYSDLLRVATAAGRLGSPQLVEADQTQQALTEGAGRGGRGVRGQPHHHTVHLPGDGPVSRRQMKKCSYENHSQLVNIALQSDERRHKLFSVSCRQWIN